MKQAGGVGLPAGPSYLPQKTEKSLPIGKRSPRSSGRSLGDSLVLTAVFRSPTRRAGVHDFAPWFVIPSNHKWAFGAFGRVYDWAQARAESRFHPEINPVLNDGSGGLEPH
jgi:hypothetical protein